jgi:dihydroorotate dehydrogenase (NAD+) catalytic subunit
VIDLCGLPLAHPVLNASGTLDAIAAHAVLGDATLGASAHVTKTILADAREGNPPPRIAEAPAGMLNSIGLPGPGIERFRADVLPRTAELCGATPIVVSIGGFSPEEYVGLAEQLDDEPAVQVLELNLSCPNVHSGCISIGTDPAETKAVCRAVTSVTSKPVLAKLSPSMSDVAAVARAAVSGGAHGLVLTNTARGMALDRRTGGPLFGGGGGGLSGPALRPIALAAVAAARGAVQAPIVGLGGIETAADAADFFAAGATVVAVGTATFRDPRTIRRVARGMADG